MKLRPIRNETDYDQALAEIDRLFDAKPETPRGDRLGVLLALVKVYEDEHWPIAAPSPATAIKYRMEMAGYTQSDLARLLGSASRASEILHGKRKLTLGMIRKLHRTWNIPTDALIGAAGD